jgi:hypothetical protein
VDNTRKPARYETAEIISDDSGFAAKGQVCNHTGAEFFNHQIAIKIS